MLSEERHSTRSPSESIQTGSVRTGPVTLLSGRQSHRSSITEEDENDNIPPAPPLPSINRQTTTTAKSSSTSESSTPTHSTPKPSTFNKTPSKPPSSTVFPRPNLHHVKPEEQNRFGKGVLSYLTTPLEPKRTTPGRYDRVSARDIENERPPSTFNPQNRGGKGNQSIFEKVDTHNGHTTYLGSGSFLQLEDCIRHCLSRNNSYTDTTHHYPKHGYSHVKPVRASVLEDYSYDGIISPKHHLSRSNSYHHYHHHYYNHDHHYRNHHNNHRKSAAELSLVEIRQVNDALAKYGISVFSHDENRYNLYQRPHGVGEIISACQLLINDPTLAQYKDKSHAVQNAWNAIPHQQPPPNIPGYASPAVQSVASHLFNSQQPPYNPVQSAISQLFGSSQQNPPPPYFDQSQQYPPPPNYNQPQQSSYSPAQGVLSRLFGQPQQSSNNPSQGVLSQLFSGSSPPGQHFTASPYGGSY